MIKMKLSLRACPVCQELIKMADIETHADRCVSLQDERDQQVHDNSCKAEDSKSTVASQGDGSKPKRPSVQAPVETNVPSRVNEEEKPRTWKETVLAVWREKITRDDWGIEVIRRDVSKTAMEQFSDATIDNWTSVLRVRFIGEQGIDAGGPRRELFSLLFSQCHLLDGNFFRLSADYLHSGLYQLFGRIVAYATVAGHPGPRRLHEHVALYILKDEVPEPASISVQDSGVQQMIKELEECTDDAQCAEVGAKCIDALSAAGFTKALNMGTRESALVALKQHYGFYQFMPAIRQFMSGLELHGVLDLLRQYPEGVNTLVKTEVSGDKVKQFFEPCLSDEGTNNRQLEEVVVYNFYKFLNQVHKKKVIEDSYDMDTDTTSKVTLKMEEVLMCLLGCEDIPVDLDWGMIEFDHAGSGYPRFNTCAPSILFCNVQELQDYDSFQDKFTVALIGSRNYFGLV